MIEEKFEGFIHNLERRYRESESDYVRKEIEQYMERQVCEKCHGTRLKPEALAVTIDKKNIAQVTDLPINRAFEWMEFISEKSSKERDVLSTKEQVISHSILKELC